MTRCSMPWTSLSLTISVFTLALWWATQRVAPGTRLGSLLLGPESGVWYLVHPRAWWGTLGCLGFVLVSAVAHSVRLVHCERLGWLVSTWLMLVALWVGSSVVGFFRAPDVVLHRLQARGDTYYLIHNSGWMDARFTYLGKARRCWGPWCELGLASSPFSSQSCEPLPPRHPGEPGRAEPVNSAWGNRGHGVMYVDAQERVVAGLGSCLRVWWAREPEVSLPASFGP